MMKPHVFCLELVWKRFIALHDRLRRSNAILDHSKSPFILTLKFLLLQSGDVQVNPGPPKHPCGLCNKAVRSNQKAIE